LDSERLRRHGLPPPERLVHLGKGKVGRETHKATVDLVTCFHKDWATAVINGHGSRRFPVGSKRAIKANTLHGIMKDFVVSFWRVRLGKVIDIRKVPFAFV